MAHVAQMLTQEPIYKSCSVFCFKPILISAHKLILLIYGDNREPPRSRQDGQAELRMRRHHQNLASNWILVHLKVNVLLCHTQDRLLHGFCRILVIIRLWIIVGCICSLILFNILLYIQIVVHHKDRLLLAIIWSKANLIAARRVRKCYRHKLTGLIYGPKARWA